MDINSRKQTSFMAKKIFPKMLGFRTNPFPVSKNNPRFLFFCLFLISGFLTAYSQNVYQPSTFSNQTYTNYMANTSVFKQEIARLEINVVRQGKTTLPITQVPRLAKGDVLKVRLLDEMVNGAKPDQSNFDWSFLVAFINPGRNLDKEQSVSQEINFRKTGWYKEYSFTVPFDSQPIFFLYPKPQYRGKILSLIGKNQEEIRKIGEKTLEISGAYGKISSFLNELQSVINMNSYGNYGTYQSSYNNYYNGSYNYGSYGNYGNSGFNSELFKNQLVERLAKSFNIQLPGCWQNGYNTYSNNTTYGTYNNNYNYGSYYNNGMSNDFIAKVQCIAKNVRIEDLDISVSRMLQQGGIMAASQLVQKYPQIAFWINIAAAALDFILQVTRKTPLKLVPTLISTNANQPQNGVYQYNNYNPTAPPTTGNHPGVSNSSEASKISLFAESQPSNNNFVTAYPIVIQKWQSTPDPEIISLPTPVLVDNCLHIGQNILKSTDLMNDWMSDSFTKDFTLVISSSNGFHKEFPLKKNIGLNGWELNLTSEDLAVFPKLKMKLESVIVGKRGFNEIKSPDFELSVPIPDRWNVIHESQKTFTVGGKRIITLKNQLGNCKCLQAVVYKPSFGGQFVYAEQNLQYSDNGQEVSFEVDATNFQPGQGQLELKNYGGETSNLDLNLYPAPPEIQNLKISKGDTEAILIGNRLEQIKAVKINGKPASVVDETKGSNNSQTPSLNTNPGINSTKNQTSASPTSDSGTITSQNEIRVAFDNQNTRQDSNIVSLELILEDNRIYPYPKKFNVTLARPTIVANKAKEVEGFALAGPAGINTENGNTINFKNILIKNRSGLQLDFSQLPLFPIDSEQISVNVQNALTDYEFKYENIDIETRIEKSQVSSEEMPMANLEVLDWKNLKINFVLNEKLQKLLGGRRLQFRIKDKIRGNSDWYTVSSTFARVPNSLGIKCNGITRNCELNGEGIEYISQVSVDGGKSWYPQQPATLTVSLTRNGQSKAVIPYLTNKKMLKIRLRDLSTSNGLSINGY